MHERKNENGKTSTEGLCYNCAKQRGINPLDVIVKNANLIRTILIVLVIVFFGMYIWKKIQFKKSEEYKIYKTFKKSLKNNR